MKEIIIDSPNQLADAAEAFLKMIGPDRRILLFNAPMGAGKTSFIKALCAALGVHENVSSPTFSIVNEYQGTEGPIYHFDFYRLKDEHEAYDLGYEEYFYSGHYCFVEWPQKIPNLLPDEGLIVEIDITGPQSRTLRIAQ